MGPTFWLPGLIVNLFLPSGKKNDAIRPKGEKPVKEFSGISIIPLAQNSWYNVRAMPDSKTPVIQEVFKGVMATGWVWIDPADSFKRFWLEVNTPKGKGWVRSDVASWQGKTSNTLPTVKGKERAKQTDGFDPKLKGKAIGFLSGKIKVNVRTTPEVRPDNIASEANQAFGKVLGVATGTVKKEGSLFWIQLTHKGKLGWVRSDVVYSKGPVSPLEQVEKKAKEAKDGIAEIWQSVKTPIMLVGGIYVANQLGLFKKGK